MAIGERLTGVCTGGVNDMGGKHFDCRRLFSLLELLLWASTCIMCADAFACFD